MAQRADGFGADCKDHSGALACSVHAAVADPAELSRECHAPSLQRTDCLVSRVGSDLCLHVDGREGERKRDITGYHTVPKFGALTSMK